ncbi:hypothetical protein ACFX13_005662 [Malus domestica]
MNCLMKFLNRFLFACFFHVSNNGQFAGLGATVTHFLNRPPLAKAGAPDFRLLLVLGFVQQLPTFNPNSCSICRS